VREAAGDPSSRRRERADADDGGPWRREPPHDGGDADDDGELPRGPQRADADDGEPTREPPHADAFAAGRAEPKL